MKIKIGAVLLLCCSVMNSLAQQHYQMMGLAVENFLQNNNTKFEAIPITWNMEGAIQADLNNGINYVIENQPAQAEGSLNVVLKKDPTLWQAYYYRAIARKQQKQYYGAIDDLHAALKLNPKLYEAYIEVAKSYLAINALTECEHAADRAIQMDKKRPAAYYVKGLVYELQNRGSSAINSFRDCLKTDSLYHIARIHMAIIELLVNKDEENATKELSSVLKQDSLHKDALLMRSILMFDKNNEQSLHDLDKLILVNPTNIMAFYLRGILLTTLQRYERGFSDFQVVIKATSTSENNFKGQQTWIDKKIDIQNVGAYTLTRVYGLDDEDAKKMKQAYCLILTGVFDKSIAAIKSTSNPTREPLAVYLMAVAYEHQGKHNQAWNLYNEAIRLDNTIADAYKKRGIYSQELKEWEASISDFTTVLRLQPDTYFIYKVRGVSYQYIEQFDKAIADYNAYLKHDSTDEQVIGYRGLAFQKINQRLNAYIDFANSHNAQAFRFDDMIHLVDSVLQKGDTTLALAALTSFVKAKPFFTEAYALKMKLHLRQPDWSAHEKDLLHAVANIRADAPKEDRAYLLTLKGIYMNKINRNDDALNAFNDAIQTDKNYAFAYLERGKFLLMKNKISRATDDLQKSASFGNTEAMKLVESLRN